MNVCRITSGQPHKKAAALWSGGKDSCLAWRLATEQGYEVATLVNFYSGNRSRSHGLPTALICDQAQAAGMSIIQKEVRGNAYEEAFLEILAQFKKQGIENLICGDIYLTEHRSWLERVAGESGISPVFPLWDRDTGELMAEFIRRGFEAIIVAARSDVLGKEWLDCPIDAYFPQKLKGLPHKVDPCGESGEFHTLVVTGPDWPGRLKVLETATIEEDRHCFLNITRWEVVKIKEEV
ncbi:MAG: diphthine--ammonia ligase [Deltaproteobacteria bacterium]|nr:MAG: diphthine--ammonia ligase [Deltaproteobacteria bacterium]